jgi:hypothetical protein
MRSRSSRESQPLLINPRGCQLLRNSGLIGEGFSHLEFGRPERVSARPAADDDRSVWAALAQHGNGHHGADSDNLAEMHTEVVVVLKPTNPNPAARLQGQLDQTLSLWIAHTHQLVPSLACGNDDVQEIWRVGGQNQDRDIGVREAQDAVRDELQRLALLGWIKQSCRDLCGGEQPLLPMPGLAVKPGVLDC